MMDEASPSVLGVLRGSSSAFLVLANLVPLIGVIVFGWSVANLLLLYWLESIIIGLLNIPKILSVRETVNDRLSLEHLGSAVFFAFHYGLFTFVHGIFLSSLFGVERNVATIIYGPLIWTAAAFFISHSFSMVINFYGKKEYLGRATNEQMRRPYGRVIVMHIVVIFAGQIIYTLGDPLYALVLLIALKTVMDLLAHAKDHLRARTA